MVATVAIFSNFWLFWLFWQCWPCFGHVGNFCLFWQFVGLYGIQPPEIQLPPDSQRSQDARDPDPGIEKAPQDHINIRSVVYSI